MTSAFQTLEKENIFVIPDDRAAHQDIRALKIAIVNLMPDKIATETQLASFEQHIFMLTSTLFR